MLECQTLWLEPGSGAHSAPIQATGGLSRWLIRDAKGGKVLGLARWRSIPASVWFASWQRPVLDVMEGQDESLLLSLVPGWGQSWLVSDAEGQRVGSVRGNLARDGAGQRRAQFEQHAEGLRGCWRALDGQELATLIRHGDGVEIRFAACLDDQPFVKMLLLAMLLRAND